MLHRFPAPVPAKRPCLVEQPPSPSPFCALQQWNGRHQALVSRVNSARFPPGVEVGLSCVLDHWHRFVSDFKDKAPPARSRERDGGKIPCGFCYLLYGQTYRIWHPYYSCPLVQPNMCRVCLAEAADHRGDNCGHAWKANKDNSRKRFQPRGTLHGSTCFRCGGPNENGKCFMENFFLEIWIGLWRIDSQLNFGLIASLEQSLAKGESDLRDLSRWILWGYAPSPHYQGWNMCLVILVVACEYSLKQFQQQSPESEYYYSSCDSDGMPARVLRKRYRD